MFDIVVIGGGPAGMAAAIAAANSDPTLKICIIERNPVLGKKIHATGNGKCNLSNSHCEEKMEVMRFFDEVGILTKSDEAGRMYPASEQASDVVAALVNTLKRLNVTIITETTPIEITRLTAGFDIKCQNLSLECTKLLLATGGKAGPQYGSLGEGYSIAKTLGHHVTRLYPVLSPLECQGSFNSLKGIRAKVNISLEKGDKTIGIEAGEIQFTEDGVSGICTFNLSRYLTLDGSLPYEQGLREYDLSIDFVPNLTIDELFELLVVRSKKSLEHLDDLLLTIVHQGIARDALAKANCLDIKKPSNLTDTDIRNIAYTLKNWKTTIIGVKGWKKAQVTGGGILTSEINEETMESKITPRLFIAGEILNYDGPSGGYNLHFAWLSGIKAGKAMANV